MSDSLLQSHSGTPAHSQVISAEITLHWLYDGQIIVYAVDTPTMTHGLVDTLLEVITQTMQNWNPNRPYLALQNLQIGTMLQPALIAHTRRQADRMLEAVGPNVYGRVATVLPVHHTSSMFRLWLEREAQHRQPALAHRLMADEQQALNWLVDGLPH
ncbi:MAG: hypothetical protein ACLFTK_13070 [Anaerolineales bacterium]